MRLLYISEGALLLLAVFYLPLVIWLLRKLWRSLPPRQFTRISVMVVASLIALAIPFWDVAITSVQMAKLCPQAGIFVNRSVKVDGFYTNLGSPDMLKRGFKYVESRSYGDRIVVYSKDGDTVKKEEFDAKRYQVKSRYEFLYGSDERVVDGDRRRIGEQRSVVRDRQINDELGYALRYTIYPGWVDRLTMARFGQVMWSCQVVPAQAVTFMEQVLLPK